MVLDAQCGLVWDFVFFPCSDTIDLKASGT